VAVGPLTSTAAANCLLLLLLQLLATIRRGRGGPPRFLDVPGSCLLPCTTTTAAATSGCTQRYGSMPLHPDCPYHIPPQHSLSSTTALLLPNSLAVRSSRLVRRPRAPTMNPVASGLPH
jgi:hypothetical protein